MENSDRLYFFGLQNHCRWWLHHEMKRCLLFGRRVMTNLDSWLKIRDITLPTKVHLVKAMVFLIVTYGCESWNIKKAECPRIHAFELWCRRRLLRIAWTGRQSKQAILKEISPEYSLEGLMLKLKLQNFCYLMQRTDSFEKTMILERLEVGGEGADRGWDCWMASPTQWTEFEQALGAGDGQGGLEWCSPWGHKELDTPMQLNWTETQILNGAVSNEKSHSGKIKDLRFSGSSFEFWVTSWRPKAK